MNELYKQLYFKHNPNNLKDIRNITDKLPEKQRVEVNTSLYSYVIGRKQNINGQMRLF
mgnify:CR=1 FL=1